MWPFPNPFSLFGDAVSGVAGWAWDKVIQGIYTWFASGVLMLMEWVWGVLDSATTPRLTEDWFASGLVRPLAAISLSITVALMLASAVQAGAPADFVCGMPRSMPKRGGRVEVRRPGPDQCPAAAFAPSFST